MVLLRLVFLLLIAVSNNLNGEETNYYARLLAGEKGLPRSVRQVTDPLLVDTNNTANRLRNCCFRLNTVFAGGPIGRLRLGMSMDEVVRVWGKPPQVWWNYQGGPRLDYKHIILFFASNELSGICINSPVLRDVEFEPAITTRATLAKWQQTLKGSTLSQTSNAMQLMQATNHALLTLSFRHGSHSPLFQLRLEQCANPAGPPLQPLNRIGAAHQPPRDKFEAIAFAKLGALDQGFSLDAHKDPDPAHVTSVDRSHKSYWLVYFENDPPTPDSGIFAWVDQKTGEVEVAPE